MGDRLVPRRALVAAASASALGAAVTASSPASALTAGATDAFEDFGELYDAGAPTSVFWCVVLGRLAAGDGGGGTFHWDSTSTAEHDGGLVVRPQGVGATEAGRWHRVYSGLIDVRWYGVFPGPGGTSLTDAFTALPAKPSVYIPSGRYYVSTLGIPAGSRVFASGAQIWVNSGLAEPAIAIEPGSQVDHLDVMLDSGNNQRATLIEIDSAYVESLKVGATQFIDNRHVGGVQPNAGGVRVVGEATTIDRVEVDNFDASITLVGASDVLLGDVFMSNSNRGLFATDVQRLVCHSVTFRGKDPVEFMTPGHNGVSLAGVTDAQFGLVHIEDSAEHGFRVGKAGPNIENQRIHVAHCAVVRPRGCGFKVQSEDAPTDVSVTTLRTQDVGYREDVASYTLSGNQSALRVVRVERFTCGHFENRAVARNVSGFEAIQVKSASSVTVNAAESDATQSDGLHLVCAESDGDYSISRCYVGAFRIVQAGRHGVRIDNAGQQFKMRDLQLLNLYIRGSGVHGFSFPDRTVGSSTYGSPLTTGAAHISGVVTGSGGANKYFGSAVGSSSRLVDQLVVV